MRAKSYKTFEKKFQPVIREDGGCLFETYGTDLQRIINTDPHHVWTLLDCDGKLYLVNGYHIVNRLNYVITSQPWGEGEQHTYAY